MRTTYEVTNQTLFTEAVKQIDTSGLKCTDLNGDFSAKGDLELNNGSISGEHGSHDYENEYGFVLIPVKE